MAYHHYRNDLIDALIDYGDPTENDLIEIIKNGRYDLNKLDASNRTPLYHVVNECKPDYNPYPGLG